VTAPLAPRAFQVTPGQYIFFCCYCLYSLKKTPSRCNLLYLIDCGCFFKFSNCVGYAFYDSCRIMICSFCERPLCFLYSSRVRVELASGSIISKAMSELETGDFVFNGTTYDRVIGWLHRDREQMGKFRKILTTSSTSPESLSTSVLKITHDHLIMTYSAGSSFDTLVLN
jgi:hypothetical protein